MASVAPGCDRMNHHPKWENNWTTLDVYITTHDLDNKISSLDIELANYFNVEFNNFEEYIKKQN
jgi:4a-hydroxytetrahydrobiopterin dehydratase